MSDQTYASPNDPYWLSSRGVDKVSFNKQAAPPLAYLDKGVLYELDSGGIWFNGVRLDGGGSGDVSSSTAPSADNALVRFDGTTGKVIQGSNIIIPDNADGAKMDYFNGTSNIQYIRISELDENTLIGSGAEPVGDNNVAVGNLAGSLATAGSNNNVFIANRGDIGVNTGDIRIGNNSDHLKAHVFGVYDGSSYATPTSSIKPVYIDDAGLLYGNSTVDLVSGPGSSVDNALTRWNGIAGDSIQSSAVILDDTGNLSGVNSATLVPVAANPSGVATVWISSSTGKLMRGNVDLEASGTTIVPPEFNGAFMVYKSSTEIATSVVSYTSTAGASPAFLCNGVPFLKLITNNSVYMGTSSGGNYAGSGNTCFGGSSMFSHSAGSGNAAFGSFSLYSKTTSSNNSCVGENALQNITTGSDCIAIGKSAGNAYTSSESNNICIGNNGVVGDSQAIRIGTTSATRTHIGADFRSHNTNLRAGYQSGNALNEATASGNTLVGSGAGESYIAQTNNTCIGRFTGRTNSGISNVFIGTSAAGNGAGAANTNTVAGYGGAFNLSTGSGNVVLGASAAPVLSTGANNIMMCTSTAPGSTLTTGSNNIYLNANAATAAEAGFIRIGLAGTQTKAFCAGITGTTCSGAAVAVLVDASGNLGTISSSREVKQNIRPIEDTSFLYKLDFKNFEYINGTILSEDPESPDYNKKQKQVGVIAEDVELIKPELVIMQGNGVKTVDYNALYVCALKELQKLRIDYDALAARVAALEAAAAP